MNDHDSRQWLIRQVGCARCRQAIAAANDAAVEGARADRGVLLLARMQIVVTACTAAGHPAPTEETR